MTPGQRYVDLVDSLVRLDCEIPDVEFKQNNFDPGRIGVLISAISNAARLADQPYGYVVWGVEDGTHEIVGTAFRPLREKAHGQPLELWLSNAISPSLHFSFREVQHSNGRVILLEIPSATLVPTKFNNIPYIRIGSTTPKLTDHVGFEASLLAKLRPFAWEHGVAKAYVTTQEVTERLNWRAYFDLTKTSVPGSLEEAMAIMAHDGLLRRDVGGKWDVFNLGAALFANNIADFETISRKAVRLIQYSDISRTSSAHEQTGKLGYAIGYEPLVSHAHSRLPTLETIGRALRSQKPIYPQIAIRELIANALLHQDMSISGTGPVIEIFSDRVEITNPGSPLLDTNRFIDLPPRSRNEKLASFMRRIGVCEERGSGVDKVIEAVEEARLPPPLFRDDGNSTKAIIFGTRAFGELTPEERIRGCYQHAVLRYVNTHTGMSNGTLRMRFGVAERNASQISRVINHAVDMQLIRPSDNFSARSGTYLPFWA